jgi:hypothetical protein
MTRLPYLQAPLEIQEIIDRAVEINKTGDWLEIDGYHISIDDQNSYDQLVAAIYEPSEVDEPTGECDWYVIL